MSTPSPEALAAAKEILEAARIGPPSQEEIAGIIDTELTMLRLECRDFRWAVEELMWMHEDKSLGLKLGDRFYIEGLRALKRQRDGYRLRLAEAVIALNRIHDKAAFPLQRLVTELVDDARAGATKALEVRE